MKKLSLFTVFVSFAFMGLGVQKLFDYQAYNRLIPVPIEATMNNIPMDSFVRFEKIVINKDNKEVYVGVGSGVVISKTLSGNIILTNHHVCNDDFITLISVGRPTLKRVRDTRDRIFYIYKIRDNEDKDMCLVFAKGMQAPAVKLATRPPKRAEIVYNISAPRGIFFPDANGDLGMAPIIIGVFNGYVTGDRTKGSSALYTINIAPGSSGSGIFNSEGELFGLVHSSFVSYDNLCLAVTYDNIKEFIHQKK